MQIKFQNLARHLAARLPDNEESHERVWKELLLYPREGYGADFDDESSKIQAILDPAVVLGRMLCVAIDNEKSHDYDDIPFSWLLRIMGNDNIKLSDIIAYIEPKEEAHRTDLYRAIREIKRYFPGFFPDTLTSNRNTNMRMELTKAKEELKNCSLVHISAPHFHKNWTQLLGENSNQLGRDEQDAKQQWSMVVGSEIENYCRKFLKNKSDSWVLQSGGGHVLIATSLPDIRTLASECLDFLQTEWTSERCWAPKLWASWDGGAIEKGCINNTVNTEIISNLKNDFDVSANLRRQIRNSWAPFISAETFYTRDTSTEQAILYLDVIGLGDRCWDEKASDRDPETKVPWRNRKSTIDGFRTSRRFTTLIESTFGRIIAYHPPSEILSMGGDEMIAKISKRDYLAIIEVVEKQCLDLFESVIKGEPIDLLWWAMIQDEDDYEIAMDRDLSDPEGESHFKQLKSALRTSILEKNRVERRSMRFVNPMWTNLIDD